MKNSSINLSKAQEEIVCQPIGQAIQVLASAGTGKTRVLTERVRHILENTKKDGIIALTFTNKAAEEMKTRLQTSDEAFNRCWIATIHSVAQRIVDSYAHTIGLPSELHIYNRDHDRKTIFLQSFANNGLSIEDFISEEGNQQYEKTRGKTIQKFMDVFSKIKRNLMTENEIEESYGQNVLLAFKNYQEELLRSGGIDFDDILVYAHKILIEQPWCGRIYRATYKHVCVDEAQDLNKAQYEFIKAFCGEKIKSLFMTGDPNQMIYGFNGSSTDYLCKHFPEDFDPLKFELKENYRSSKSVIRLANKLKPGAQKETDFALEGQCQIKGFADEKSEAQWVCNEIKNILESESHPDIEGSISLNNICVIARNRFIFKSLEEVLEENNISFQLKKNQALWEPESNFGKILDFCLRLKLNPKDWISQKKLTHILKISNDKEGRETDILNYFANQLSENNKNDPFAKLKMEICKNVYSLDMEQPNMLKFFKMLKSEMDKISKRNLEDQTKQLQSSTKMDKISSLDLNKKEERELELSMRELEDFQKLWLIFRKKQPKTSLFAFRNAIALGELIGKNREEEANTLMLSTVHTMKGLEKDIVFLIGMCEGVFPDYRANSKKELEEEKNNAFVAITRSKRWIYITYPNQRKMPWEKIKKHYPSSFISQYLNNNTMQVKKVKL